MKEQRIESERTFVAKEAENWRSVLGRDDSGRKWVRVCVRKNEMNMRKGVGKGVSNGCSVIQRN
jgi:hypothetical protein